MKMTRAEYKAKVYAKKAKRAIRTARFRGFKNFMFWLTGVLCSFAIIFGSIFVGVKVVPIGTYLGGNYSEYISDTIAKNSVLDAILNIQNFKIDDFKIVKTTIKDLMDSPIDDGTKLSTYINVDYDKLGQVQLSGDIATGLSECLSFNEQGIVDQLGENNQISVLTEYQEIDSASRPTVHEVDGKYTLDASYNPRLYYYQKVAGGGVVTQSARVSRQQTGTEFIRIFNDDGTLTQNLSVTDLDKIKMYYAPLLKLPMVDAISNVGLYINYLEITDVLGLVGVEKDAIFYKALDGITVGEFMVTPENGGFNIDMLLGNLTLEGITGEGANLLGKFGELDFLKGYVQVEDVDRPQLDVEGYIPLVDSKLTHTPQMYYMLDGTDYVRAFDDDGKYVGQSDYNTTALYYANLSKVPLLDLVALIGESLSRQQLLTLLQSFDITFDDDFIITIFDGVYIGQFIDGTFNVDSILAKLTLDSLSTDGKSILGDFANLKFFNEFEQITNAEDNPELDLTGKLVDATINPKLYYVLEDGEYVRAFDDDGKYVGQTEYALATLYYANLSKVPLLDAFDMLGDSFAREKLVGLLTSLGMTVDPDYIIVKILGDSTIGDLTSGAVEVDTLLENITIADLNADGNILGDLGNLTFFKQYIEACDKPELDLTGKLVDATINPKLYYVLEDGTFVRAFDDEGKYVGQTEYALATLYYANLSKVSLLDAFELLGDCLGMESVKEMLTALGMTVDANSLIFKIIGDSTVNDLAGGNLSIEDLTLKTLFEDENGNLTSEEADLLNMLSKLVNVEVGQERPNKDTITLAHVSKGINLDNAMLSDFGVTFDSEMEAVLISAINANREKQFGAGNYDVVTSGNLKASDLKDIDFNFVKLTSILKYSENTDLYKYILSAKGLTVSEENANTLTIDSLNGLTFANMKLTAVIDYAGNEQIYAILTQAKGIYDNDQAYKDITITDVSRLNNLGGVKLSTVIGSSIHADLKTVLGQVVVDENGNAIAFDDIKVSNLSNFSFKGLKLNTLFGGEMTGNKMLDALLKDASVTVDNLPEKLDSLMLYDLYGAEVFTIDEVEGSPVYYKTGDGTYSLVQGADATKYYLNEDAGIWLLLCYDSSEVVTGLDPTIENYGRATTYTKNTLKLADMNDGATLGAKLMNATIRQLIDANLLTEPVGGFTNQYVYALSIAEALANL